MLRNTIVEPHISSVVSHIPYLLSKAICIVTDIKTVVW